MGSPEGEEAVVATAAVVEDGLRGNGDGGGGGVGEVVGVGRSIDMEWRKAEEAAIRRYEAANWLRRVVGVVCGKDLAEEPSEEEFRLGLRNGIVLCNALNKVQPGSVPKVVEAPSDSADGAALCAYQYFENVRNFLMGLQDLGLPTFEASDLEKGGKGVRVVDCVLSLRSFSESKQVGRSAPLKYGGILKPSMSGKHFIRKNSEPFVKTMVRSYSAELLRDGVSLEQSLGLDFSLEHVERTTPDSIRMLVQTMLSDKRPEEIPSLVESLLSRVIHEFERRTANQNESVKHALDPNDDKLLSRADTPPEMESTCTCSTGNMDEEDHTSVSMKEEVSTAVLVNGENVVEHIQAKQTDKYFDQQQKHIKDLKSNLATMKSGMEHIKLQYSEDLDKLGKHVHTLSHAASGYHKVLEENRKLYNQIQDLRGNIRVYCRVRPFLPGKVFADMQPLIRSVLDGYNVCIFAYGQTGSGKTFTMSGPKVLTEEGLGVNYRALNDLFNIQAQRKDTFCYEISVQMIEIYNEQVRDLLQNETVDIKNSSQKGIAVPDANIVPVTSTSDVIDLMNLGQKNRAVCSTAMNDRSSRSHSCLTVHVQGRDLTSRTVLRGCMHLVDLAGSERVDKSEVVGDRLKEAQHINKSLAALGDVIASLAQKNAHVPYRNSKLTQLLQDSLAPEPDAIGESISTLKFAERVATVELGAAKSNKEGGEVKELKEQIACLKAALAKKDGETESIRSTQSSPDIYRMRMGSAPPAFRNPMEEVGNLETRSNGTPRQKKRNFELPDVENDTSSWLDTSSQKEAALGEWVNNSQFGSSNSLLELGPDATQDVVFYQRNSPEPQWSWAGSVATEDSDDFEVTTSCSSEQDMVRPTSAPKAPGSANGSASIARKAQPKGAKSTDIRSTNPAKRAAPLQKKINGPPSASTKNGKQSSLSAADGKRAPNGKVSAKNKGNTQWG
uniref:Putative kinesin n=1 Tax=Oryza sativa subsp. indica TaxID=39946 RepID=A0A679BCG0_ORYSI|nr:putative kinesin [Oryza sativa Indica Group]